MPKRCDASCVQWQTRLLKGLLTLIYKSFKLNCNIYNRWSKKRQNKFNRTTSTWAPSLFWQNQLRPTMRCWLLWGTTRSCWERSRLSTGIWIWLWRTCRRFGQRCPGKVRRGLLLLRVDSYPRCFSEAIPLFMYWKILNDAGKTYLKHA